jgi:hypothetical protein
MSAHVRLAPKDKAAEPSGCPLSADFVAEVAEEESGRGRRAKLSLPLAGESGGGDYSTDSNATWRDLTLTPRMRPRAEAAVPRTWPTCGGSERWLPA